MNNINKYFNEFRDSIYDNIVGNVVGEVERVSGNTADVSVEGLPLLINLPIFSVIVDGQALKTSLKAGDRVLVAFNNNDLSDGYIVANFDSNSRDWIEYLNENLEGTPGATGEDGIGLEYNWNGTQLGVKREDESSYKYIDLKGEKGEQGIPGSDAVVTRDKIISELGYTPASDDVVSDITSLEQDIANKANFSDIPTSLSQLKDDSLFLKGAVSWVEPSNPPNGFVWFKPKTPHTDYLFRYDATSLKLNDKENIAIWQDSSTNGFDLTSHGDAQPIFHKHLLNNRPTVAFNNSLLKYSNFALKDAKAFTIFMVASISSNKSSSTFFEIGLSGSGRGRICSLRSSGSTQTIVSRINNKQLASASIPSAPVLITSTWDGTNNKIYADGTLVDTIDFSESIEFHNVLTLGGRDYDSIRDYLDGYISEVVYFERELSDNELLNMHNYFRAKWGL